MELNGALSNPRLRLEIQRWAKCQARLLDLDPGAATRAAVPDRPGRVAHEVQRVLAEAGEPLRAKEVHRRCQLSLGEAVSWSTVRQALMEAHRSRRSPVARVAYGTYAVTSQAKLAVTTTPPTTP